METKYRSFTDILIYTPSMTKGFARLANTLGNNHSKYNSSESDNMADSKAIYSDWVTIGNDMRNVMEDVKK